tara:strand:+ start:34798 stop:35613 length:816 start_codon:yes stop_codon:yes gene_type:complete
VKFRFFVLCFSIILAGCSAKNQSPLIDHVEPVAEVSEDIDIFPPLLEMLTLGIVNDKEEDLKADRKAAREAKYVTDENDARNIFEKAIGAVTLGLVAGRETKKERAARLLEEERLSKILVSDAEDDRNFVEHGFNFITAGVIAGKETKEQRALRLQKEAERESRFDKRGIAAKSIEVFSFGTIAPGKPVPVYPENAVMKDPVLGQFLYGISKYDDVVEVLGKPIKQITKQDQSRMAIFKVYEEKYKLLPYLGTPQKDVHLNFNAQGLLVKE